MVGKLSEIILPGLESMISQTEQNKFRPTNNWLAPYFKTKRIAYPFFNKKIIYELEYTSLMLGVSISPNQETGYITTKNISFAYQTPSYIYHSGIWSNSSSMPGFDMPICNLQDRQFYHVIIDVFNKTMTLYNAGTSTVAALFHFNNPAVINPIDMISLYYTQGNMLTTLNPDVESFIYQPTISYDVDLYTSVVSSVNVPVITSPFSQNLNKNILNIV